MKKKLLSFIMVIFMIIPCAFLMTACGGDKPVDLAGKKITCTKYSDVYWQFEAYSYYKNEDGKTYSLMWNLEQFVENVFNAENGKEYLEELCYYSTKEINTLEEAKAAIENYVTSFMVERNPVIVFSADGKEAKAYAYSDNKLTKPLKTYSVQKDGENVYKLYEYQEQVGNVLVSSADNITCSGSAFKLDGKQFINQLSGGKHVMIKVPLVEGAGDEYIEVALDAGSDLSFMLDVFLSYKVKK